MSRKPIRERLIRELLEKGNMTIKEIAEHADCTAGYVYKVRTEVELEKALAEKNAAVMQKIAHDIDQINSPAAPTPWVRRGS